MYEVRKQVKRGDVVKLHGCLLEVRRVTRNAVILEHDYHVSLFDEQGKETEFMVRKPGSWKTFD